MLMPTKTTKKAVKKTKKVAKATKAEQVKHLDLSKPFDLTDVSPETLESYAFYLKEMLNSGGWKLMEQVLEGNMSLLEKQIVSKRDIETSIELDEEAVDLLRVQHAQIVQLINTPRKLIKQYGKPEDVAAVAEYDPYSFKGKDSSVLNACVMSDTT